jgi:hypothetical protein
LPCLRKQIGRQRCLPPGRLPKHLSQDPILLCSGRTSSTSIPKLPGSGLCRNAIGVVLDILRKREQDFRAGVEKLFQLTSALREGLKTTTSTDVLNVTMYKRLQEVEKLAKQLESEAKG